MKTTGFCGQLMLFTERQRPAGPGADGAGGGAGAGGQLPGRPPQLRPLPCVRRERGRQDRLSLQALLVRKHGSP